MSRILITFSCLLFALFAQSQDANNLALDATVKDQAGGRLTGVSIVLIQDGALVNKVKTGKNGRFDLLLDFDHEYIIEASKAGYVSKRMHVNTRNVPEDEQLWGYEYGGFAIDLFKKIEGVDFGILDKPVAKIYYDPNIQNFDYDKVYTKQIKAQLDDLIEDYKRKEKMQEQLLKQKEEDYQVAMKDAANALEDGDLLIAKENYLAAASIKPESKDAKNKIAEIEKKIQAESGLEDKYMATLATADQLYGQQKFSQAKAKYDEASKLKPGEDYPIEKAKASAKAAKEKKAKEEAEALLAESDRKYNAEIEKADAEFTSGNYQNARTYYQNALSFKSEEEYPKNQLLAIEKKIADEKEAAAIAAKAQQTLEKYKAQIAKADAAFKSGNYQSAKSGYEQAQSIKADETYPGEQLAKIDVELKNLAEAEKSKEEAARIQREYQLAIAKADKAFKQKSFEDARTSYNAALGLKPDEKYPADQIVAINAALKDIEDQQRLAAEAEEETRAYNELIAAGVNFKKEGKYDEAIDKYNAALAIKENERLPKDEIKAIEALKLASAADQEYASIISRADGLFEAKSFDEAKSAYNEALAAKPLEKYPKNQIAAIEKEILRLEKEAEATALAEAKEKQYQDAIAIADGSFDQENYEAAIKQYETAQKINPDESYPKDRIRAAKAQMEALALSEKEAAALLKKQTRYNELVAEADASRDAEKFEDAKKTYNLAAGVLPNETYPKEQITTIDKLIEDRANAEALAKAQSEKEAREAEIEENYSEFVRLADGFMDSEDYLRAKAEYEKAAQTKPDETYPTAQIAAIDKLLDEMALASEKEENQRNSYNQHLAEGDRSVASKNWDAARESFNLALGIYPDEAVPAARLKEIDQLEAKQVEEELEAEFNALVKVADQNFLTKNLSDAQTSYEEALELKPDNAHCKLRLQKISEILSATDAATPTAAKTERTISEENFQEGNAKVTVRTVVEGEKTDVYKRVIHSWGGKYFFLNDQPISELLWNTETTK